MDVESLSGRFMLLFHSVIYTKRCASGWLMMFEAAFLMPGGGGDRREELEFNLNSQVTRTLRFSSEERGR